jgi:formyltetrahydrofolate hydrolase
MKQFATITVIGLDKTGVIAQGSFTIHPDMELQEIVAAGQRLGTRIPIKALKLYLAKRLDVYWGTVKQV